MPRGSKKSYSSKQKRMAQKIEKSAKSRGRSTKTAERIAFVATSKRIGGAKRKSSSRSRSRKEG